MNQHEFSELMEKTLQDQRLSRNEKQVLKEILADANPNGHKLNLFRQRAFELARESLADPQARKVLDWLEEVVKALNYRQDAVSAKKSKSEAWFSPDQDCPRKIGSLIKAARRTLDICVFTITDNRLTRPILDAKRRGVKVRIITDNDKMHDIGSDIKELVDSGVAVRIDHTDDHMHHKFALFDGALLMSGSYNWTRSAANDNFENFLVTDDAGLIQKFTGEFEKLWERMKILS